MHISPSSAPSSSPCFLPPFLPLQPKWETVMYYIGGRKELVRSLRELWHCKGLGKEAAGQPRGRNSTLFADLCHSHSR